MASMVRNAGRRWLVCGLGLVLAATTTGCSALRGPTVTLTPPPETAYDRVIDHLGPGGAVSLQVAEQVFALEMAPLPGVTVPAGARLPVDDGTEAVTWLARFRTALTPAQQKILDVFDPPARSAHGSVSLADYPAAAPVPSSVTALVASARAWYAGELGRALPGPVDVTFGPPPEKAADARGYALSRTDRRGRYTGCSITLTDLWRSDTSPGDGQLGIDQIRTVVHEMFHCFQYAYGPVADAIVPDWITEGGADWATAQYGGAHHLTFVRRTYWWRYMSGTKALFDESYEANGFYESLAESGVDVWQTLDAIEGVAKTRAACPGPCEDADMVALSTAAFATATSAHPAALDTLLSHKFGDASLGGAWTLHGYGMPPVVPGHPMTQAHLDDGDVVAVDPATPTTIDEVTVSAPIVVIEKPAGAIGSLRLPDGTTTGLSSIPDGTTFCTTRHCPACPDGTQYAIHAGTQMFVAVTTVPGFTGTKASSGTGLLPILDGVQTCPPPPASLPGNGPGCATKGRMRACTACQLVTLGEANKIMNSDMSVDANTATYCDYHYYKPGDDAVGVEISINAYPSPSIEDVYNAYELQHLPDETLAMETVSGYPTVCFQNGPRGFLVETLKPGAWAITIDPGPVDNCGAADAMFTIALGRV